MGRPGKFDEAAVLDAAAELVASDGPAALSIVGVAQRLGAPSGSIYHRFRSRDLLAASLWVRTVERFQAGWLLAVDNDDARTSVRRSAAYVLDWSREHLTDAGVLLLYRSSDLLTGPWPEELKAHNEQQLLRLASTMDGLSDGLGATSKMNRRRVVFAAIDLPYGAIRGPLARGFPPEPELDAIVDDAVVGVLEAIDPGSES